MDADGLFFLATGIIFVVIAAGTNEKSIDYTHCTTPSSNSCAEFVKNPDNYGQFCTCEIDFTLGAGYSGNIFVFYGLENFYQNHRQYVRSRDDAQLHGDLSPDPSENCYPYQYDSNTSMAIAPCGAIANSLFNDTFTLKYKNTNTEVPMLRTGIAWKTDRSIKFNNPSGKGSLEEKFKDYARPPSWHKDVWQLDPANPSNNGFENEDFIVWMRTAALPSFRKPWRRVNHTSEPFSNGLPSGNYTVTINYAYPVDSFHGRKRFIISTTNVLGSQNPFLGICYIVMGSIMLTFSILFFIVHKFFGNKSHAKLDSNGRITT